MPKTITIRLDDEIYERLKGFADSEHRPISNFIEHATLNYIEEAVFADELEMLEILGNKKLVTSLRKGSIDAKRRRGRFAKI